MSVTRFCSQSLPGLWAVDAQNILSFGEKDAFLMLLLRLIYLSALLVTGNVILFPLWKMPGALVAGDPLCWKQQNIQYFAVLKQSQKLTVQE